MKRERLTKATAKAIISDLDLFVIVGKAAGLAPTSLFVAVKNSSRNIMQHFVLKEIATHLGKQIADIVEPVAHQQLSKINK